MTEVLFRTLHGSHLYGLNHTGSDLDYYTVVDRNPTVKSHYCTQTIVDGVDSTVIDLSTWLHQCSIGVPQALEAMFAPSPEVDEIPDLRAAYRAGSEATDRYLRTIKNFAYSLQGGEEQFIFKRRRHALRLAWNLRSLRETGRFDPRVTPHLATIFTGIVLICEGHAESVYNSALTLAGF